MLQKPAEGELFCKNEEDEKSNEMQGDDRKPAAAPDSKRAAAAIDTATSTKKVKMIHLP